MNADTQMGWKRTPLRPYVWLWPLGLAVLLVLSHALLGQESGGRTTTSPPRKSTDSHRRFYRLVEARAGETCIVCGKPVEARDRVYMVEGQRVPVHSGVCEAAFATYPELFLSRLRPRGAFLSAEPNIGSNISWGWFALGIYVLLGLVFGAACAYRAVNQALSPWPWFLAGFCLNIFGFLALVTRPAGHRGVAGLPRGLVKVPTTYSPRPCPKCGTMNHPSAKVCVGCGSQLEPVVSSEVARVGLA